MGNLKGPMLSLTMLLIVLFLGKSLIFSSNQMFEFHDETQAARIQQFALNLKNLKIPPRLAPDFSYKMGYPVFNFYAPFSYFITAGISLAGLDIVTSLKFSFLISILLGFIFSYMFFRLFFDDMPSIFGGVLYSSSLYFAIEIFVRGNLGEAWFLALLPLTLYLLYKNSVKSKPNIFFLSIIALSSIYSVHNLLSIIFIPVSVFFALILKNKKINLISIFFALLFDSYFLVPLIAESPLTYAKELAILTDYKDHFLCPGQLWQSLWGFGGSIPGCNDGMPFMVGKPQIIFFTLGIIAFVWPRRKINKISVFFLSLTAGSLFLSTQLSQPLWNLFSPFVSIIQFPWRFISFSLLGLAFFGAYFFNKTRFPGKEIVIFICSIAVILFNSRYFSGKSMSKKDYISKYLSQEYIEKQAAYKIMEYLPKTSDYQTWISGINFNYLLPFEAKETNYDLKKNTSFEKKITAKSGILKINIQYFPFWQIFIDDKIYIPNKFDSIGRPIVNIDKISTIFVSYKQTNLELLADYISLLAIFFVIVIINNKFIWKKIKN